MVYNITKVLEKEGGESEDHAKGVSMVKKFIALFVSSIFALSLGIAYAQEETTPNPWERDQQKTTSAKKEDKAKKKDKKTSQEKVKKTNKKKAKKTDKEKAEKADMEKAEKKKEPEQKKKYIFW